MKSKWVKKLTSVLLVAAMTVGCVAGCGTSSSSNSGSDDTEGSVSSSSEDPITLTVFSERANYSGTQVGWMATILKEKFNVVLNIVNEQSGVFETRMEDGDLGDIIIWGSTGTNYKSALTAGMLYDWNEDDLVEEYAPYIYENMQNALESNSALTAKITEDEEDTVYGIGNDVASSVESHASFFYTWDIRWDLYQQLGYPEVNTLTDLIDVFKQMKEICPTDENGNPTYAVSLWPDWDVDIVMYVKSTATAYYGYDEFGFALYDPATGDLYGPLQEDGPYLEMLEFYNKLYQEGLIDPDSMTNTYENMIEKVKSGGTFWSIFNYSGSLAYNTEEHLADGKAMYSLVPTEANVATYGLSTTGGTYVWSIGASTEYPELCMEIINYFYTPEGYMTMNYGPEELCWYYGEDGYTYFTEFGWTAYSDTSTIMPDEWGGSTFSDGSFQGNNTTFALDSVNPDSPVGESFNYLYWKSYQSDASSDIEADWREYTGTDSTQEYMESQDYTVSPSTAFSMESKSTELTTTWNAVKEVLITYSWRAIYADSDDEFDSIVAEMKSEAESYGYEDCIEYLTEQAADRYEEEQALEN